MLQNEVAWTTTSSIGANGVAFSFMRNTSNDDEAVIELPNDKVLLPEKSSLGSGSRTSDMCNLRIEPDQVLIIGPHCMAQVVSSVKLSLSSRALYSSRCLFEYASFSLATISSTGLSSREIASFISVLLHGF